MDFLRFEIQEIENGEVKEGEEEEAYLKIPPFRPCKKDRRGTGKCQRTAAA